MNSPKVSVIIPAYNGANFLGEAIQSVLAQTYQNFELIVVDDASPDHTAEVIKQFDDSRLRYIVHEQNQGSDVARHTGLQASSGDIIAFLDQDDFFHPEKLHAHVTFLERDSTIGLTYNARFELDYSSKTIRDIWRPPPVVTLADLVLGYPFAPGDVVFRRKWAYQMDLIGGSLSWCGGEIVHFGGLFLAGCKFGNINRVLNYRRYHSGRLIKDLAGGCQAELYAQSKILNDPRCPDETRTLHDLAHSTRYTFWGYCAFVQNETTLGQDFIRKAVQLHPLLLEGTPCELVNCLLINCIEDERQDHESLLKKIFAQLPVEMAWLSEQEEWAVAHGYLLKGLRAVIWGRLEDGRKHFARAASLGAQVDESFLGTVTYKLLNYEAEFGAKDAQDILHTLGPYLRDLGSRVYIRRLNGCYSINRAFQSYRIGEYAKVPKLVIHAIANEPKYVVNRGVLSILLHSSVGLLTKSRLKTNSVSVEYKGT